MGPDRLAQIAVAPQQGWPHSSHQAMKAAARRLANEHNDWQVLAGFHANYYHDFMVDFDLDNDRPDVHDFVHRVLALLR